MQAPSCGITCAVSCTPWRGRVLVAYTIVNAVTMSLLGPRAYVLHRYLDPVALPEQTIRGRWWYSTPLLGMPSLDRWQKSHVASGNRTAAADGVLGLPIEGLWFQNQYRVLGTGVLKYGVHGLWAEKELKRAIIHMRI